VTPTAWLALVAMCWLGAALPGPSLGIILRHALRSGRAAGLAAAWAHASGIGLYAGATAAGLGTWLRAYPGTARWLAGFGALYLAWLGVGSLINARRASAPGDGAGQPLLGAGRDGLIIALTNPKVGGFFLALFAQFTGAEVSWLRLAVLIATPVVVDGLWYSLMASVAGAAFGRERLAGSAAVLEAVTGVSLLAFAAVAALRAAVGS